MEEYKMWASLVTGSRKYGKPRKDSDIDLVVLVSPADLERLREAAALQPGNENKDEVFDNRGRKIISDGQGEMSSGSFKFGILNLIATTDPAIFQTWALGTKTLKKKSPPPTRAEAIKHLRMLRNGVMQARDSRKKYEAEQRQRPAPPAGYDSLDDIPF